jgi:N6-adenosine-specific RNA methylase IME4
MKKRRKPTSVLAIARLPVNLPGELSRTGWSLPVGMKVEQWLACGAALNQIEGAVQWWVGDWWRFGEDRKDYGTGEDTADQIGFAYQTCMDAAWVADRVPFSRRRENLTFGHHKEVAAKSEREQEQWLDRAEREQWSANELRAKIRQQAALDRTVAVELDAHALGKFVVLYADPPWRYENPPMGGGNRSIENHYPTMELDEICALPVGDIAHENSVLFMWATSPKRAECHEVLKAWGFNYRTDMVWVKDRIGMGYHVRERHEALMIAKRGELPPPATDARPDSVIEAPRLEHSAKPPVFYEIIDKMYPGVRKLELFGRNVRDGWTAWGNQIGSVSIAV